MGGRGRWAGMVAVALTTLVGVEVAAAGTNTVSDPNDRPGRLDIRSASQGHAGDKVKHVITTFGRWPTALLGPRTPNFFLLEISTDQASERIVVIFSSPHRIRALVFHSNGNLLGRADASRPNRRSVQVKIRRGLLGNPAGYFWRAVAFFRGPGCGGGCTDRAGRVLHDIRAPAVSFPQPTSPATTNPYNLDFTVGDSGESGLASWRLEHRLMGTTTWTLVNEGLTSGPRSEPFTAAGPSDVNEFRVVAVDGHGNRTVSPVRSVQAPP